MTSHKHKQFLQFHRSSLLQCDDGRSLLITQDRQQTDWGQQSMHIHLLYKIQMTIGLSFCVIMCSSNAPKTILAHPVLRRFYLGPSCLTTKFYQTIVWVCDYVFFCFLQRWSLTPSPLPTHMQKFIRSLNAVLQYVDGDIKLFKWSIPGLLLFFCFIFLHQDRLTNGVIMFSRYPFVRPSVRLT